MILLDTNVLIYASDSSSRHHVWACGTIAGAVATEGGVIDAIVLAEILVGEKNPETVASRIREWRIEIHDVPVAAARICADAYREYGLVRKRASASPAPRMPLPDFFIGAHAQAKDWGLATADASRFKTYFPSVSLTTP